MWVCIWPPQPQAQPALRCRCGRGLETVLASYQKANVDQLIAIHEQKLLDTPKAREDASKLAQELEEAIRQQERRKSAGWAGP